MLPSQYIPLLIPWNNHFIANIKISTLSKSNIHRFLLDQWSTNSLVKRASTTIYGGFLLIDKILFKNRDFWLRQRDRTRHIPAYGIVAYPHSRIRLPNRALSTTALDHSYSCWTHTQTKNNNTAKMILQRNYHSIAAEKIRTTQVLRGKHSSLPLKNT